jgi:hypothetical protein
MILLFLDVSIETLRAIPETESFDGVGVPVLSLCSGSRN